jgi:ketosteroid isomerase-like protein
MSQQNVEIVRRFYAEPKTELALDFYAPDIEWDMTHYADWMDDPVFRGHDGVRTFMRNWIASFDKWELTVDRVIDAGDDVIAVVNDMVYVRGSRVPIHRSFAQIFTFRAGVITTVRVYSNPDEALEVVGLGE